MVYEFIIPIEKSEETEIFIKKMYCLKCKERGGCSSKHNLPVIEEGYHFDIVSCVCSNCSETFDLKFFNENSFTNHVLKQTIAGYGYKTD
ncbi:MAG: hypothetical protein GOP50_12395 [Candidatus Heimdallarchaeota archaeon]|nr:hypothetical protein [Candidatus Heimdallarchaeota archaeon]